MDEDKLRELEKVVNEIRETQNKIAEALLGSLNKDSVGLIEETRNTRKEILNITNRVNKLDEQVSSCLEFRTEVKKIVALIALSVPFIFEGVKLLWSMVWEHIKKG